MFGQGLNFGGLIGASGPFDADFLVVAGGGGGGAYNGGGGGGGGLRTSYGSTSGGGSSTETALSLSVNTPVTVIVGAGGSGQVSNAQSVNGSSSTLSSVVSIGGGKGGGYTGSFYNGSTGGSGGGAAYAASSPGAGTTNQGFAGGTGDGGTNSGGGGGAGAIGQNGSSTKGGNGGSGVLSSITGSSIGYAGGGGGAGYPAGGGSGGTGANGGGNGGANSAGTDGIINTGGGGGGSQDTASPPNNAGGSGGSGTVILRYPTAKVSSYAVTGTLDTVANTAYPIANTAYYKLNGGSGTTVTDSSGNGYNGTATSVTYAAGRFGDAAVFNGSSSFVTLPDSSSISQINNFSWSFWVKPNGFVSYGTIATFYSDYRNYVDIRTGGILGFGTTSGNQLNTPTNSITNGVWQHVALTKSSTAGTAIYINGVSVATNPSDTGNASDFTGSNYQQVMGSYSATGSDFFPGSIDQFRIFSSVLSAGNVTSLYNESTIVESTDGNDSILQFTGGSGDITFS